MKTTRTFSSLVLNVLFNDCPECAEGRVFKSLMRMHERCPACGTLFEREQGYFTGAMSISYFLGFFLMLPTFLPLVLGSTPLPIVLGLCTLEAVLLSPLVFRFSRLIWIHLERRFSSRYN